LIPISDPLALYHIGKTGNCSNIYDHNYILYIHFSTRCDHNTHNGEAVWTLEVSGALVLESSGFWRGKYI